MPLTPALARAPLHVREPARQRSRGDAATAFVRDHALALIVALGLAIRLALLLTPRSYFPDEIFQYLEPAHRLAFGSGIVPWEYRYGVRSWLLPLLLSGPMALGAWLAPGGGAYLLGAKLAIVATSLLAIVAAGWIGGGTSRRHGLFAAFVVAIWSETALFGTQALTEAIAVSLFLPGAALLYDRDRAGAKRLVLAGALLALAAVLRFQYAPSIALFTLLACGRDALRWWWVAAGSMAVLFAAGALDQAMGQVPFGWIVENFRQNIVHGRSHLWVDGPFFYPLAMAASSSVWLLPLVGLAIVGARRYPALFACAVVNILLHSLIAHKEYRYILLSTTLLVVLAAIGTVDATARLRAHTGRGSGLAIATAGWLLASLTTATLSFPANAWSLATPALRATAYLRQTPGLCGIALAGTDWTEMGGYTYLHHDLPLYVPESDVQPEAWLARTQRGYDAVMAPPALATAMPPDYRPARCFAGAMPHPGRPVCVFIRPGGCDPAAAARFGVNAVLARIGR